MKVLCVKPEALVPRYHAMSTCLAIKPHIKEDPAAAFRLSAFAQALARTKKVLIVR